jgi:glutathione peroxidase
VKKLIFKYFLFISLLWAQIPFFAQDTALVKGTEYSIYQYIIKDIDGNDFDFSCLEGKKILVVNTGSKCMYRGQLSDLQKLYEKYKERGFIIVAFPSNDFFYREPGNNNKIKRIYRKRYDITFPVMAKTRVKGRDIDPVYDFLSYKIKNGLVDNPPKWNFQKYLIDSQGFLVKAVNPSIKPFDKEIIEWIETSD